MEIKESQLEKPFRVTAFDSPTLRIPFGISDVELSVTQDKLVITVAERHRAASGCWITWIDNSPPSTPDIRSSAVTGWQSRLSVDAK